MKHRSVYIAEAQTLPDTGTYVFDIKPGAPITAIELIFAGTKGATENQGDHVIDYISAIELLDGGLVLASVSGRELIAENCYRLGDMPAHDIDIAASGTPQQSCFFLFGRFLFDPDYYLDPSNYRNLQLKVTTNLTAAAGTYTTGSLAVDVMAHVMDEGAGAYQGYFAPKTVKTWTTAASGTEEIDMPTEDKILLVLAGSHEDNIAVETDVSDWKLTADADKHIIFDFDSADWKLRCISQFGRFNSYMQQAIQDTDVVDAALDYILDVGFVGGDEDFGIRAGSSTGNRIVVAAYAQT